MSTSPGDHDQDDSKAVHRAAMIGAGAGLLVVGVVIIVAFGSLIGILPMALAILLPFSFGRSG